MLRKESNKIILKGKSFFLVMTLGAGYMAYQGISLLCGLFSHEEGYTGADILGAVFVCFWTLMILCMGIYALLQGTKKIIIDEQGVLCKTLFTKRFLTWPEIADWGISYCGQTRGEGNTYYLYFSEQIQSVKNECRKKLRGSMIKYFIMGDEYYEAITELVPFCKERCSVEPFIGKEKYHFI